MKKMLQTWLRNEGATVRHYLARRQNVVQLFLDVTYLKLIFGKAETLLLLALW